MAEISCKHCNSLDCRGCNIYRLEQMLDAGKLDPLMNENRLIQISADVRPVVHAHWEIANRTYENSPSAPWICSECKKHGENYRWYGSKPTWIKFCETCGAVMDEEAQDG